MNQILVTKKLYVTPELKRKKKIYKIDFILSVFLLIALTSAYVYSVYDRNKDNGVAEDILSNMDGTEASSDALTVALDDTQVVYDDEESTSGTTASSSSSSSKSTTKASSNSSSTTTVNGVTYNMSGTIDIPSINVSYPILVPDQLTTSQIEATLKVSPCKFWGGELNEVGNYCIVGHNYRNTKFFSKVPTLNIGDTFTITDVSGRTLTYKIYDMYTVNPSDVSCTSQLTNGKTEVTLITCTNDSKQRVIVKSRSV